VRNYKKRKSIIETTLGEAKRVIKKRGNELMIEVKG